MSKVKEVLKVEIPNVDTLSTTIPYLTIQIIQYFIGINNYMMNTTTLR